MNKRKIVNNLKDGIKDASAFLIHDVVEIASMQSASFFNIDKFLAHAYKKVSSELIASLSIFYPRSDISHIGRERTVLGEELQKMSLSEISSKLGYEINRPKYNIFIDPITNIKSFSLGMRDFSIATFIFQEGIDELKEAHIYNPNIDEFLQFKNGMLTVNDKRFVKKTIKSVKEANFGVIVESFGNLKHLPKITPAGRTVSMSDDKYAKLIEFISNKNDFLIKLKKSKDDDFMLELLQNSGYSILKIGLNGVIDFDQNEIQDGLGFIVSNRDNIKILKLFQDKISQV